MNQPRVVKAKHWWQSSIVWLGALQIAAGLADVISKNVELFGSDAAAVAGSMAGVLIVLRRVHSALPISSTGAATLPPPDPLK